MTPEVAPYGAWKSSLTAARLARGAVRLRDVRLDGGWAYWLELRPAESGRHAVLRANVDGGPPEEVLASEWDVRTRVHEYGGGAFHVRNGAVVFTRNADQCLWLKRPGAAPARLVPESKRRYADPEWDLGRNRVIAVVEDHGAGGHEPKNYLVAVPLAGGEPTVLAEGHDFYSSPRLSPNGRTLAWLTWDHPNLPWDATELWIADVKADGRLGEPRRIAGGPEDTVFQPEWSPDGRLHFIAERTGWWNLYAWDGKTATALAPRAAEFGQPQWVFAQSTYGFAGDGAIVCAWCEGGEWHVGRLAGGRLEPLACPYNDVDFVRVEGSRAVFLGGAPDEPVSVVALDLRADRFSVLKNPLGEPVDPGILSEPEPIVFPTEGGKKAYAFYYAPRNAAFRAPAGTKPPLLCISHGGPTAATSPALSLEIQFWTSRGFGVVDVNYGGSTGYGREYRRRLNGQWGIVDVADCVSAVRFLVGRGDADPKRLAIRGGSAGGYTTLAALVFRDVFRAGASYYGVADIEALMADTHKFESKYDRSLIGPYPESKALYRERSPIHFVDRLSCPLILLQGLEDKVVPPNQAEAMFAALKQKGIPVAYVPFAGEQHGFRRAENIQRSLEAELYFYSRIFGFSAADSLEPVEILNL